MSLDKKILDRIKRENLKIRSRWFFAMKNFVFGIGTLSSSILGSLSLALLLEIITKQNENLDWLNIPYVYLILFGVFLFLGYWLLNKIGSLYKIKITLAIAVLFFISLSFGYLTFASGKAEEIEKESEKIPIYSKIVPVTANIPLKSKIKSIYHYEKTGVDGKKNDDNIKSADRYNEDKKTNNSKLELKNENINSESASSKKTQSANANKENQSGNRIEGSAVKSTGDKPTSKVPEATNKKSDSHRSTTSSNEDVSSEE